MTWISSGFILHARGLKSCQTSETLGHTNTNTLESVQTSEIKAFREVDRVHRCGLLHPHRNVAVPGMTAIHHAACDQIDEAKAHACKLCQCL